MPLIFPMKRYPLATVLAVAGCSSAPKYVPPPASALPATITNYSNLVLWKFTGVKSPEVLSACQARVVMIDGAVVPNATRVSVSPGEWRISLFCQGIDYSYRAPGDGTLRQPAKGYSQKYDVVFPALANFNVEPFWENGMCRARLVDDTGRVLPMKDVLVPLAD